MRAPASLHAPKESSRDGNKPRYKIVRGLGLRTLLWIPVLVLATAVLPGAWGAGNRDGKRPQPVVGPGIAEEDAFMHLLIPAVAAYYAEAEDAEDAAEADDWAGAVMPARDMLPNLFTENRQHMGFGDKAFTIQRSPMVRQRKGTK